MGPVSKTITIDAPRERVYQALADLARRPAFCDHFQLDYHLQRVESRGVGAAARFRVDARRFGIWMETVISELDPPYLIRESGRGSRQDRMPINTVWELVDAGGGMCELTVTFWGEPDTAVDKLKSRLGATRWYGRRWAKALRRLAEQVEAEREAEPLTVAGASRI